MAETLTMSANSKEGRYQELLPQIRSVVEGETDLIANMANVASMLHQTFGFWWTGFYRVQPPIPSMPSLTPPVRGRTPSGWLPSPSQGEGKGEEGIILPLTGEVREGTDLVLGPFQGPLACTRIRWGKGVCGTAWQRDETVIVPDVDAFPGHIACSSLSRSEIVVPVKKDGEVVAVLDIDSKDLNTFDEVDKKYLEEVARML